jgi:hypothetical protein
VIYGYGVPSGGLNISYTELSGHNGDLPLQGKIPMAEQGIEPRPHGQ